MLVVPLWLPQEVTRARGLVQPLEMELDEEVLAAAKTAAGQAASAIAEGTVLQLRKAVLKKNPEYDRKGASKKAESVLAKMSTQSKEWDLSVEKLMHGVLQRELCHLAMIGH